MKVRTGFILCVATLTAACGDSQQADGPLAPADDGITGVDRALAEARGRSAADAGFTHGVLVRVDGTDYYLAGPPDGPDGASDIPGHSWVVGGNGQLQGKHVNTGPFGAPSWWSSDAGDGELLYLVHGVIDTWTPAKAAAYAERGYIHYHELVAVDGGDLHPDKVVWLRHIARTMFTLDGGPHPELSHQVTPGLDLEFVPNGMMPYDP